MIFMVAGGAFFAVAVLVGVRNAKRLGRVRGQRGDGGLGSTMGIHGGFSSGGDGSGS